MTAPKLVRRFQIIPGYDDIVNGCEHTPKGEHGRHGEAWYYTVRREDDPNQISAIALEIGTKKFPPGSPYIQQPPNGVDARTLVYHISFPYIDDDGEPAFPRESGTCLALGLTKCVTMPDSALYPRSFVQKSGFDPSQPEPQSEEFWLALEAEWYRQDALVQRFDIAADEARRDAWTTAPQRVPASHNDIARWLRASLAEQHALKLKVDALLSRTADEAAADRLLEVRENVVEVLKRARNLCITLKGCNTRKEPALPAGIVEQFDRLRYELAQLGVGELT